MGESVYLNLSQIAARYGKSLNTVGKWPGRGGPVVQRGGQDKEW